jgi:hypothetical protein
MPQSLPTESVSRFYQKRCSRISTGARPENDSLSDRVDEVHLDEVSDVRLRLADRRVMILVGGRDFRTRMQTELKVLDAADRQDVAALGFLKVTDAKRLLDGGEIAYLNASRAERVIVGLAH